MTGKIKDPNLKDRWEEMQKERMRPLKIRYDPEFRAKFAKDGSRIAKYNDYEYGKMATAALGDVPDEDCEVLEIGAGPGTLTIPLSCKVKKILAIESSEMAVEYLAKNIKERAIENVEILEKDWLEVDTQAIESQFDLVVCSHFLWQVKDLEGHLKRMELASKRYCAVIQPAGRERIVKDIWSKVTGKEYKDEFEPDADQFAYPILRQWGRLVKVQTINYSTKRSLEEEVRYVLSFIAKYIEVDSDLEKKIKGYVAEEDRTETRCSAVVMWWEVF